MPFYKFTEEGTVPPESQAAEWLPDDVAALKVAAAMVAEIARDHFSAIPFIIAVRVSRPKNWPWSRAGGRKKGTRGLFRSH